MYFIYFLMQVFGGCAGNVFLVVRMLEVSQIFVFVCKSFRKYEIIKITFSLRYFEHWEGRNEMYITTQSTHFIYGYVSKSDIW